MELGKWAIILGSIAGTAKVVYEIAENERVKKEKRKKKGRKNKKRPRKRR